MTELPTPDGWLWLEPITGGICFTASAERMEKAQVHGYCPRPVHTADTVRRLLAERDERIRVLTEALRAAKPWLDAMLSRPPQTPEMIELLARVESTLAKGDTNG